MAARRRYTAKERAKATGIAMVEGVTAAERVTGIPKTTIQDWTKRPEYVHLRTTARETVAEGMWVGIQVGVRELVDGLTGDAPLHHKAAAFQALADRYALLTGGPTARTETHDWKFNDYETVERASAVLVEELTRRTDEGAATASVGPAGKTGAETPTG